MLHKGLNVDNDYNLSDWFMSQEMVEYKYSVSNEFGDTYIFLSCTEHSLRKIIQLRLWQRIGKEY